MDDLTQKIKNHPDAEVVITSCRDINWERDYFITNIRISNTFFLESPVAKITRRNDFLLANDWYRDNLFVLHQHILQGRPYNL
ncbi:MAG: hypothetical protein EOO43_06470 [Flavobacterium sp.]|nr:MAG: hypothetical protein EOO43_06470 [Flavobacterium sp.]